MDQELQSMRIQIQERILNWLEKRNIANTPEWHQRLPDISRRVEASVYKDCPTKEEYAKNFESPIEMRLPGIMRGLQQQYQQLQQLQQQQQQLQQQQQQLQQQYQQLQQRQQQLQQQQRLQQELQPMRIQMQERISFSSSTITSNLDMMHNNNNNNNNNNSGITGVVNIPSRMESNSASSDPLAVTADSNANKYI